MDKYLSLFYTVQTNFFCTISEYYDKPSIMVCHGRTNLELFQRILKKSQNNYFGQTDIVGKQRIIIHAFSLQALSDFISHYKTFYQCLLKLLWLIWLYGSCCFCHPERSLRSEGSVNVNINCFCLRSQILRPIVLRMTETA